MLWGRFAVTEREPHVFWGKKLGNMDSKGYSQHIFPGVIECVRLKLEDVRA